MTASKRPWQGTVLAVLAYAMVLYCLFSGFTMIFGLTLFGSMGNMFLSTTEGGAQVAGVLSSFLGGMGVMFGVFVLAAALVNYFIGRAFWVGKHWPITLTNLLSVLALFVGIPAMEWGLVVYASVFFLLTVTIWEHPFYRRKG